MAVQARFVCRAVAPTEGGRNVALEAVYSDDPASPNHSWSRLTPAGFVNLTITNPAAFDQFEIGKVYDLTFVPVGTPR